MSKWRKIPHDETGARKRGAGASAYEPAEYGFAHVRYGPGDFAALLWGELGGMLVIFLLIVMIGLGAALTLKKNYTASASLLVGVGDEYVYRPSVSDAGRGAVPLLDTMVSSERELLLRQDLRIQVLRELGLTYVFPELAKKYAAASPAKRSEIMAEAAEGILKNITVSTAPGDAVIGIDYKAHDPVVAARVLNTLLADHIQTRGVALLSGNESAILQQKQIFQDQLTDADAAYQAFLQSNQIGDFGAARTGYTQQLQAAMAGQYDTAVKLAAARAQLGAVNSQIQSMPTETAQYRDVNSATSDQLNTLRAQREAAAQVWAPGSQPLRTLDEKIAQLQAATSAGRGETDGTRRIGANPVYQTAQTNQITLEAQVAALSRQKATYDVQVGDITARLQRLAELEPQFTAVSQNRDLQLANVRDINAKATANSATQKLADAVTIANRAAPPTKGASLRKAVLALAILFGGFSALMYGLLRIFLRPGLPTPAAAGRTLDLPILGVAAAK